MNETVEKFIFDCKNNGKTYVPLIEVPYDVLYELVEQREPALSERLADGHISPWLERLDAIRQDINRTNDIDDIKTSIDEAIDYQGSIEWISGDVLEKTRQVDCVPVMKSLADACLRGEINRLSLAIDYLFGKSSEEDGILWEIKPVIDSAVDSFSENLDAYDAVFDTRQFKVAFFKN